MNILLPVDFSNSSFHAARYAIETFGQAHNYTILHCIHVSHAGATVLISLNEEMMKLANQEMENFMTGLAKFYPDYDLDPISDFGSIPATIKQYVHDENIDLVVMGTRGASGLRQYIMGSNAQSVAHGVDVPVLVVPHKAAHNKPKRILFATDFANDKQVQSIETLAKYCKTLQCSLHLLHVSDVDEDEDNLAQPIKELDVLSEMEYTLHVEFGKDIESIILEFANRNESDIIATIPHDDSFLERIFQKSISKNLIFHSDTPLLVL